MMDSQSLFTMVLIGCMLPIGNVVESYGLGKCPNYPSMEDFNITKVILYIGNRVYMVFNIIL